MLQKFSERGWHFVAFSFPQDNHEQRPLFEKWQGLGPF